MTPVGGHWRKPKNWPWNGRSSIPILVMDAYRPQAASCWFAVAHPRIARLPLARPLALVKLMHEEQDIES